MKNPRSTATRSLPRSIFPAVLAGLLLASASSSGPLGCSGNQIGGTDVDMSGGGDNDGGPGGGDGGSSNGDGGQSAYCMGKGPPIVVGDSMAGTARCSGQVAASAFRYAMCLCQGLSASSQISTDSFDSTAPGQMTLGNGGSVGINSNLNASTMSVGGSLIVTGAVTLNSLTVGVDAQISDRFSANQTVDIKRNAVVGSDVICNGPSQSLKIAGSLTFPAGRTLTANNPVIGGGTLRPASVSVPTPCDCSGASLFNIAGYVTERASSNDNAAIGLDPNRLVNFMGDQTLDLSCGRFYLSRIGGAGKLTLNVSGRTALFIGGDVNLTDTFAVNLGASGELDLFINGGLTSSAPLSFGNKNAPARVRLYMGGSRNINLAAGSVLGGNVYAPESALVTAGPLEVFGAIFVRSFNPSASVTIHHDIAILKASEDCNPTGGGGGGTSSCTRCQDCGGQACKGGSCGSCTTAGDCCPPLSCRGGKCVFEVG
jgi:hypothetical protein